MRADGGGATTLKPLHLDVEYRDAFGCGAAQVARVPPSVDDDIIRGVAPTVLVAHRHSSYTEGNRHGANTVPPRPAADINRETPPSII
jgi:hypothetical protein